jgi:hypothetical protein
MTKVLKCNDLNPGCTFEARGNTDEDVLKEAAPTREDGAQYGRDSSRRSRQGSKCHPR